MAENPRKPEKIPKASQASVDALAQTVHQLVTRIDQWELTNAQGSVNMGAAFAAFATP